MILVPLESTPQAVSIVLDFSKTLLGCSDKTPRVALEEEKIRIFSRTFSYKIPLRYYYHISTTNISIIELLTLLAFVSLFLAIYQ